VFLTEHIGVDLDSLGERGPDLFQRLVEPLA
jgi:hypothetical protein